eukprot:COSAG02_NODE_2114_length_9799_cov_54.257423_2_plen_167_part_00
MSASASLVGRGDVRTMTLLVAGSSDTTTGGPCINLVGRVDAAVVGNAGRAATSMSVGRVDTAAVGSAGRAATCMNVDREGAAAAETTAAILAMMVDPGSPPRGLMEDFGTSVHNRRSVAAKKVQTADRPRGKFSTEITCGVPTHRYGRSFAAVRDPMPSTATLKSA